MWLECADCGTDCYDEGIPHYDSEAAARAALLGEDGHGWTERRSGRLLCSGCSSGADCAEQGHDMGEWTRHPDDKEIEFRHCQHCGGAFDERLVAMQWPS